MERKGEKLGGGSKKGEERQRVRKQWRTNKEREAEDRDGGGREGGLIKGGEVVEGCENKKREDLSTLKLFRGKRNGKKIAGNGSKEKQRRKRGSFLENGEIEGRRRPCFKNIPAK